MSTFFATIDPWDRVLDIRNDRMQIITDNGRPTNQTFENVITVTAARPLPCGDRLTLVFDSG
jgi:hypothetical protein